MLIADRYAVGRLVVVHHDPSRSDVDVDAMAAAVSATPGGRPVSFAVEGLPIDVLQDVHVGERARGGSAISSAALSRSGL
jgi:hypothetical protein